MADSEDGELLGMIDDNSEASSTCDASNQNELSLTFKQEAPDVVGYRVVHLPTDKQATTPTTVVTPNQQYFVIHDANAIFVNNRVTNPRKIAPKTVDTQPQQIQIGPPPAKKRDDRRRATHNEVERRRRDKINHWIMKLGSLIPADGLPGGERDRVNVNSAVESKGAILSKACEYISSMKSNYETVSECLKSSEEVNNKLQSENQFLKELLDKHGIAYDGDGDITILS